jgi:protease-4
VIRIDSGGGSATAGEMMWRAIARLARRKPVVVSIGEIAASGGYYIAAPAREIYADPSSLTGSIGIFYGKADVSELLAHLHVGVELDRRGDHADMESMFRPSTPEEITLAGRLIQHFYEIFLDRVASGRHMTPAAVNAVGQGHIWSGARASGLGLVDRLAGLDRARQLAQLPDDCDVLDLPAEPQGLLEQLVSLATGGGGGSTRASAASTATDILLANPEVRAAVGWLLAVAYAGRDAGHVLALTEWPLATPR